VGSRKRGAAGLATRSLIVVGLALGGVALRPGLAEGLTVTYMCFFDAGSAELSERCQMVLREFVRAWERYRRGEARSWPTNDLLPAMTHRVEVDGRADAAESGAQAISDARAHAVANFLQRNGLSSALMPLRGYGSDRPLVPVEGPEPQNRRVHLLFR
jgi:outer membrane protein OmpA-like peptidoglycan-associated protein